ncbi:hypothetical protein PCL1606_22380 [Pseudomonas chlororaphis]|uniref:Uncharacterized protein n=1 Tax=Pseudomonas chlororaphis TaxID=587753 RepID=A0A0D5XY95_9PSED|nr:hypothetical protein PCL1606_22380 [Pseudomonas chlororaphis]
MDSGHAGLSLGRAGEYKSSGRRCRMKPVRPAMMAIQFQLSSFCYLAVIFSAIGNP